MRQISVVLVLSAVLLSSVSEAAISCDDYNSGLCFPDLKGVCLTNGTIMRGTCDAKEAICAEGAQEAADFGCCDGSSECRALNAAIAQRSAFWAVLAVSFMLVLLQGSHF